jgi:hypothetical protein
MRDALSWSDDRQMIRAALILALLIGVATAAGASWSGAG